jgi:hypothetical protein
MTALQQQDDEARRVRSRHRVRVLKDLFVFQFKLLLEGFKDIVLGPLSLGAATLDFIQANEAPTRHLDAVMRLGQRFEEALDLYAASGPAAERSSQGSERLPAQTQVAAPGSVEAHEQLSPP